MEVPALAIVPRWVGGIVPVVVRRLCPATSGEAIVPMWAEATDLAAERPRFREQPAAATVPESALGIAPAAERPHFPATWGEAIVLESAVETVLALVVIDHRSAVAIDQDKGVVIVPTLAVAIAPVKAREIVPASPIVLALEMAVRQRCLATSEEAIAPASVIAPALATVREMEIDLAGWRHSPESTVLGETTASMGIAPATETGGTVTAPVTGIGEMATLGTETLAMATTGETVAIGITTTGATTTSTSITTTTSGVAATMVTVAGEPATGAGAAGTVIPGVPGPPPRLPLA